MKLCLAFLLMGLVLPGIAAEEPTQTMEGEYQWNREGSAPGPVKAIFSEKGNEQYEVSFHFTFRGENYVYTGIASGKLKDGELAGEVKNEEKNRTFTFKGVCKDGKFEGTHMEIGGRRGTRDTGTITLAMK